jgi:hypothetical protein
MTQINAGVSFKGRLPQIVGQAALAASVLAGGASLLNAGGAMAVDCLSATLPPPVYTPLTGTPPAVGSCSSLNLDEVDVTNQFTPPTTTSGTITYSLTASPDHWWTSVELDSTHGGVNVSVKKDVFQDAALTIPIAAPLISDNGNVDGPVPITGMPKTIYVRDVYTIGAGGQLASINNEFVQTPGPLPILGAGAAFGFSRKLRSRIKAGRTA